MMYFCVVFLSFPSICCSLCANRFVHYLRLRKDPGWFIIHTFSLCSFHLPRKVSFYLKVSIVPCFHVLSHSFIFRFSDVFSMGDFWHVTSVTSSLARDSVLFFFRYHVKNTEYAYWISIKTNKLELFLSERVWSVYNPHSYWGNHICLFGCFRDKCKEQWLFHCITEAF